MNVRNTIPMRAAKIGYIVMSLVFCGVGVLFLLRPELSALTVSRILGAAMILFGGIKLVGYFSRDLYRLAFQYDLEFGLLLIALGVIVVTRTTGALSVLLAALGVAVLADGLFKVQIALDARRFGIRSWWATLILAILTGCAGLILVLRPWDGAVMLTRLLGVALIFEGVLNLCVAVSTVKIVKHQRPDVIEIDQYEISDS